MNKNVMIISSSLRRKGNSEILCEQFIKGIDKDMYDVEYMNLNDYHILPCLACEYCR